MQLLYSGDVIILLDGERDSETIRDLQDVPEVTYSLGQIRRKKNIFELMNPITTFTGLSFIQM